MSSRPKFVSLVFNSWQEVMQYMMTVRSYSLEQKFVSFIKLFGDIWSGLIAVIERFVSVKKLVQFVDITCGAKARPSRVTLPGQLNRRPLECNRHSRRALREDVIRILFSHRSPEGCRHAHSL